MTEELKECPFCGSQHVELVCSGSQWFVQCNECDSTGPGIEDGASGDSKIAADAWNGALRKHQPDSIESVFAIVFQDGVKIQVEAVGFSVAKVKAAYQRMTAGATKHTELTPNEKESAIATKIARGWVRPTLCVIHPVSI